MHCQRKRGWRSPLPENPADNGSQRQDCGKCETGSEPSSPPGVSEDRQIGALWQADPHALIASGTSVVLRQLGSESAGLDPHDRIYLRIVIGGPAVDFHSDDVFLDLCRPPGQALL